MSQPKEIPKNYDPIEVEERWMNTWKKESYYFDRSSKKPQFIIDTPPPYPTGNFHIGNAFNWCYIDFIARYKRMCGFNVMFPQGWDCHGLPTEVKVEELNNITKNDVPRDEFRKMCRELTLQNIEKMRKTMWRCGFSNDWSNEYITMMPEYYKKTQLSFLRMYKKGDIYQSEHPVNFCTRCETAIAFAEVSYEDRTTKLNFFDFDGVEIATSRPELLAACVAVAVHPDDDRYKNLTGKTLKVPLFGHDVRVISDEAVDPSFGSGAVMICTFGDKQDVHWWVKHKLDLRCAITLTGKMTEIAGKYAGMSSTDCRAAILSDMENEGILKRQEPLEQRVGTCWRCKTPIEILSERQWFVKVHNDDILENANKINWTPEHMKSRLENWASQMEWDWCISRQRIFATPIPVWFCNKCGEVILPDESLLPVDPTSDMPENPCPKCGSTEFTGEKDVLDTWMDSSISVLNITGWDGSGVPPLFPAQIRPQGHDIIRTWAFYTILRAGAITGEKPWDEILVNGMVLGDDGFKMSKSRGNIISPEEVIAKHGADAFRQWSASGAATGQDIVFSWNDVIAAARFQTKMWNICRFVLMQLEKGEPEDDSASVLADRWLMDKLSSTEKTVTECMDSYNFAGAILSIREFAREIFADNYIELVKGRLYGDGTGRGSALFALRTSIDALCRMLSPFTPYFSEECYTILTGKSVHSESWVDFEYEDEDARLQGELLVKVVSEVRRYKHDEGLALNALLGHVVVYTPYEINDGGDAASALNANLEWKCEKPKLIKSVSDVKFNFGIIGPVFRKQANSYMNAIRALSDDEKINPPKTVLVDGSEADVLENSYEPVFSYSVAGETVDVLTISDDVIVTVQKKI